MGRQRLVIWHVTNCTCKYISLHWSQFDLNQFICKHQSVFNVYISCLFARPSDPCEPLSLVAMVSEFLLSCVIFGKFYLALFVELANRIFSQFIKTWSKLAKSRGKSFTILFQSQINLWNKENFNQINLQNFAASVQKKKVVIALMKLWYFFHLIIILAKKHT